MYVISVTIWVKPEHIDPFIAITLDNARNTRLEPGNLRFDVCRATDDPTRFLLYEVYVDEAAFAAHQTTEHYFRWRDTVGDWMAQKREGRRHTSLFPEDDAARWRA